MPPYWPLCGNGSNAKTKKVPIFKRGKKWKIIWYHLGDICCTIHVLKKWVMIYEATLEIPTRLVTALDALPSHGVRPS
jgi:hypothetical protein